MISVKPQNHFSLIIYTKPYLKKYLQSLYGNPIIFDKDNLFGVTIAAFLEKPLDFHVTKEELRCRTDKYTEKLEIFLPKTILTKRRSTGYDLSDANTITLNKFFETRFTEDLARWCELGMVYKVEFKKNIEDFCHRYKIELEYDITFDAIKKKEYRLREKRKIQEEKSTLRVVA